jgi:2-methylisocitrate lyase-like PEP mutase family enzyme
MNNTKQSLKTKQFRQLHENSCIFVLPNAWDSISAKIFEECGFKAIGTTSAGIAVSQGYSDRNIPFKKTIATIKQIVDSVNLPVSADIEAGYGETVEEIIETVRQVISVGVVGINLEDSTNNPNDPLYDISLQKKKITAIKELSESMRLPLFINARTDMYWLNIGDPSSRFQETIKRANTYQEAGADCIFIPGVSNVEMIKALRKEISCPINLLAGPDSPSLEEFSKRGIERISCGSGPFRATATLLKRISEEIINHGTFHQMTDNILSYDEISDFMHPNPMNSYQQD